MHLVSVRARTILYSCTSLFSLSEYDLTIPLIYDISGNIVSESALYNHRNNHPHRYPESDRHSIPEHSYQLNINGLGENFHVHLHRKQDILAPGFKVYRRTSSNTTSGVYTDHESTGRAWTETNCHYSGSVVSHGNSSAYLSVCGGVVSITLHYQIGLEYVLNDLIRLFVLVYLIIKQVE